MILILLLGVGRKDHASVGAKIVAVSMCCSVKIVE